MDNKPPVIRDGGVSARLVEERRLRSERNKQLEDLRNDPKTNLPFNIYDYVDSKTDGIHKKKLNMPI